MQDGKVSHGYTADIPQPWLVEKQHAVWDKMDARADRSADVVPLTHIAGYGLFLSMEERIRMGEFAHILRLGKAKYHASGRRDIRNSVHVTGVKEADELMSRMGRRCREPWFAPRYRENSGYIDDNLVTVPVAHLLLRELLQSFVALSVGKVVGWRTPKPGEGSPLLFSSVAIAAIKVWPTCTVLWLKKK
jgi:hypothetical protein